jgi:hypothetical protein
MCGSGAGIGTVQPIMHNVPSKGLCRILWVLLRATTGCSGAVAGSTIPGAAGSRPGSTTTRRTRSTSTGFGSSASSEAGGLHVSYLAGGGQEKGSDVRATCKRARRSRRTAQHGGCTERIPGIAGVRIFSWLCVADASG